MTEPERIPVNAAHNFVLVDVVDRNDGEIIITTTDDTELSEPVIVITATALVNGKTSTDVIEIVMGSTAGFQLLRHMLSDSQMDAVMDAEF